MVRRKIIKNIKLKMINIKRISNNKGSTMVETLVSFVVLVIILAIIYQVVSFCNNLRLKSIDTDNVLKQFNAEIYKPIDKIDSSRVDVEEYAPNDEDGSLFIIELDTTNTDVAKNIQGDSSIYSSFRLTLGNMKATCYRSNDSIIDEEQLATPKALVFKYE